MSGNSIMIELLEVGRKMDELERQGKFKERNKLAEHWRVLYRSIDFGYRVGDQVRCPLVRKNRIFQITRIRKDNYFELDNNVIVPGIALKKYEPPEQLSFEF